MKKLLYFIPILAVIFLLSFAFAKAAPISWDFNVGTNILQPLQSAWSALVKAENFQATSTTKVNTFPNASTTALSILGLATPAGAFLAIAPNGAVIATTTPSGSTGITDIGPVGQMANGPVVTFATTTSTANGVTNVLTITGSGDTLTFTPSVSGTLSISGGGTGTTTSRNQGIYFSDGVTFRQASTTGLLDYNSGLQRLTVVNASTTLLSVGSGTFTGSALTAPQIYTLPDLSGSPALGSYSTGFHLGRIPFGSSGILATSTDLTFDGIRLNTRFASTTAVTISGPLGLTLDSINGPLQANNGAVSATTSIGPLYGGTGTTTMRFGGIFFGSATNGVFTQASTTGILDYNPTTRNTIVQYASSTALTVPDAYITRLANLATNGVMYTSGSNGTLNVDSGALDILRGGTATTTAYDTGIWYYDSSLGTFSQASRANSNHNLNWDRTTPGLGIGTTTPWGLLSVNANGLGVGVPQFTVGSSTGTNLLVANNGRVGVGGTTTPTSSFSVGTTGSGGFFTNASTGNSTTTGFFTSGSLATAAGTFVAADPNGRLIATTTPGGVTDRSVRAFQNAVTALTTSWVSIVFQTESFDTDSMHDNAVNPERITFTTGGKYLVVGCMSTPNNTSAGARIRVDGTTVIAQSKQGNSGNPEGVCVTQLFNFTAAQYVELQGYASTFNSSGDTLTNFAAFKVY